MFLHFLENGIAVGTWAALQPWSGTQDEENLYFGQIRGTLISGRAPFCPGCLGVKLAALLPRADFFYYGKGECIRVCLDLEGATQGHSQD